jgi:hypothetical protein
MEIPSFEEETRQKSSLSLSLSLSFQHFAKSSASNLFSSGLNCPVSMCRDMHVGMHTSGFKDFLLKPELLRAIQDCGFEHPSDGKSRRQFRFF